VGRNRSHFVSRFANYSAVFRNKLFRHLSIAEPEDFRAFTWSLVQSRLDFSAPPHTDALCEILITGDVLRVDGSYGYETPLFMPFAVRFAKDVDVFGDELQGHLAVFEALVKRYFETRLTPIIWPSHATHRNRNLHNAFEASLGRLLQYAVRWPESDQRKFAIFIGMLLRAGIIGAAALHVFKVESLINSCTSFIPP
jgi:hypothetical protein